MEDYGMTTKLIILEVGMIDEETGESSFSEILDGTSYQHIYKQLRMAHRIPEYEDAHVEHTPDIAYYQYIIDEIDNEMYNLEWNEIDVQY